MVASIILSTFPKAIFEWIKSILNGNYKSPGDAVIGLIKLVFWVFIFIIICQQLFHVHETWVHEKSKQDMADDMLNVEDCKKYQGSSEGLRDDCKKAELILKTWPITRAIRKVVHDWDTCLTMSCSTMFFKIINQWELKILLIFLTLGSVWYIFQGVKGVSRYAYDQIDYRKQIHLDNYQYQHQQQQQHPQTQGGMWMQPTGKDMTYGGGYNVPDLYKNK